MVLRTLIDTRLHGFSVVQDQLMTADKLQNPIPKNPARGCELMLTRLTALPLVLGLQNKDHPIRTAQRNPQSLLN